MVSKRYLKKTRMYELNEAYQKVLQWFFSFPENEIGLSDLSEALKISKTTANRIVRQLSNEGFLEIKVMGRIWRISCNKEHAYNYTRKVGHNLSIIYESGIIEEIHKRFPNPRAIVLFGSYRKGDDTDKSDIDIAVEILDNEDVRIEQLGIIPLFGLRENVVVNMFIFSRNKVDLNLFSNIANGIVLEGFLEVRP